MSAYSSKIFEDFVDNTPDFYDYTTEMLEFLRIFPAYNKPECIADVYKFAKLCKQAKIKVDKNSLDYILGLV